MIWAECKKYDVCTNSKDLDTKENYTPRKIIFEEYVESMWFFLVIPIAKLPTSLEANHSWNCGLPLFFSTDSHP